jgi:hypothetical protein
MRVKILKRAGQLGEQVREPEAEPLAAIGEEYSAIATLEHALSQMVFQRLDLPAYRAMRHMQFFGRAHQALMACSRFEYPECAERRKEAGARDHGSICDYFSKD